MWGRRIYIVISIVVLVLGTVTLAYPLDEASSAKAREILEKVLLKYDGLFRDDGKGIKSVASRLSIKGDMSTKAGNTGSNMLNIDVSVELYASQPNSYYMNVSGNLGNLLIVIPDKKPLMATLVLPNTRQFATMNFPEKNARSFEKLQSERDRNQMWKDLILEYEGIQDMKSGKAHRIKVRSKKPSNKQITTFYILDKRWDPVRIEMDDPTRARFVIDIDKLEFNGKIPAEQFTTETKGYTKITQQQVTAALMMQIMSAAMQYKPIN